MKIIITGHGIETGESFQKRINIRLSSVAEKYNARIGNTNVVVESAPRNKKFQCKITAHAAPKQDIVAEGSHKTANGAFDQAAVRFEKQIRRNSRALKDVSHEKNDGLDELA